MTPRARVANPYSWPWLALVLIVCVLGLASTLAQAANDFLPVDEAFAPSAARTADGDIAITWQIADTYYLYRHAFDFELVDAGPSTLGEARIPDGEKHTDEFFGPVETYRDSVRVVLPIADDTPLANDARIRVTYQGCADAGLCYPPQTKTLTIDAAPAGDTSPTNETAAADSDNGFLTQQDDLAGRLAGAGTLPTLGLFFLFGLLLAFTPCILPMIPILSGLIVGAQATPARAFTLSLAYVLAMAAAYTVFGVIAGYFGANLQAALQRPWVLWPFAGLFILLGTASFGWFDFQMPGRWQGALSRLGQGQRGLVGAAVLGFAAALIAGPCLALLAYFLLPLEYKDANHQIVEFAHSGRITMSVLIWMGIWWFTEAIDISATALLPLVLLPILGATSMEAAAAPYAHPLIFLFMGGFLIALSMRKWGMDKRVALITLSIVGTKPGNMIGGFMLVSAVLSAFVSNTATTTMIKGSCFISTTLRLSSCLLKNSTRLIYGKQFGV